MANEDDLWQFVADTGEYARVWNHFDEMWITVRRDEKQITAIIPKERVRELRDWLTAKLEGKIEISRRSELKKVEGGQNKLTHILYSDGSADCETEFIPTKLEGKDERTRN